MDFRRTLLTVAEAYSAETGRSLGYVSKLIRNDGKFFRRLAEGAGCTIDSYEGAMRWFSQNWPEDLPWPSEIPRPALVTADSDAAD